MVRPNARYLLVDDELGDLRAGDTIAQLLNRPFQKPSLRPVTPAGCSRHPHIHAVTLERVGDRLDAVRIVLPWAAPS